LWNIGKWNYIYQLPSKSEEMEKYQWYIDLLKKQKKDPEYWKQYTLIMIDEFEIAQRRVFELESAMQRALGYLKEFHAVYPLHDMDDLIIDEFEQLLKDKWDVDEN
jgi:hypothetical protein